MKTQRTPIEKARVTRGSQNVFADLGFNAHEAEGLAVKAELTRQIHHRIKGMGLTQLNAAALLGVSQPDVSKLMNGRYTGYSVDRLITLLNTLSVDVDIVVRPRARGTKPGSFRVIEKLAG